MCGWRKGSRHTLADAVIREAMEGGNRRQNRRNHPKKPECPVEEAVRCMSCEMKSLVLLQFGACLFTVSSGFFFVGYGLHHLKVAVNHGFLDAGAAGGVIRSSRKNDSRS